MPVKSCLFLDLSVSLTDPEKRRRGRETPQISIMTGEDDTRPVGWINDSRGIKKTGREGHSTSGLSCSLCFNPLAPACPSKPQIPSPAAGPELPSPEQSVTHFVPTSSSFTLREAGPLTGPLTGPLNKRWIEHLVI